MYNKELDEHNNTHLVTWIVEKSGVKDTSMEKETHD